MDCMKTDIAIYIKGVTKRFSPGTVNEIVALDELSLEIPVGEWVYIVGGNGSGKSTLLRTIYGQWSPDSGTITTLDHKNSAIFFVESGNQNDLVPSMTVYENLMLTNHKGRNLPSLKRYRNKEERKRFIEILIKFNLQLENRLDDQVVGMSSGQQQAVVAAKVLLSGAKIILLDEFTSALDKKTAPVILRILQDHARINNVTIIAVTHDYQWIQETADRVVVMESGKVREILRAGDPDENCAAQNTETRHKDYREILVRELSADIVMERLYGQR